MNMKDCNSADPCMTARVHPRIDAAVPGTRHAPCGRDATTRAGRPQRLLTLAALAAALTQKEDQDG